MRVPFRAAAGLSLLIWLGGAAARAEAVTPEARCQGMQLVALGQRVSLKLNCRAWAKLTDKPVARRCLARAERTFLKTLASAGSGCADPGAIIDLAAQADAMMSETAARVETTAPLSDPSGLWVSRTAVGANPAGADALVCNGPGEPPCPAVFAIFECRSRFRLEDGVMHQESECTTPEDSPEKFPAFGQLGSGPYDPLTGEFSIEGNVDLPGFALLSYKGEGVFSPGGRSYTVTTTAGFDGDWLWLATTSGKRVQD